MDGVSHEEQVHHDAKEYDNESRHEEGPAPGVHISITVRPEGRDNGAQDVPHRGVRVPNAHDQTTTAKGEIGSDSSPSHYTQAPPTTLKPLP